MTGTDLPIACLLDAAGLRARESQLACLGRSLISVSRPQGASVVLRFSADEETRNRLDRIVAAERECCPFLDLKVRKGQTLELTIDGPDEAAPVIAGLTDAIRGSVAA
jgi:phosphotransferase system HPr-like phosphotransfer protein